MKIVILDAYTTNPGDLSWDFLREFGEAEIYDRTEKSQIAARTRDANIVITNKTPLTRTDIDGMKQVRLIALLSTGYNVVDYLYAGEKGIPVCNIPAYSTNAVAQLVFSLITALSNGVMRHSDAVHGGEWSACPDFCFLKQPIFELSGKTLGIVGFGKIGNAVADIAEAFGMHILAVSRHETDQSHRKNFRWVDMDTLARESDILSFHCPLTPATEGLVNREFLKKCKKTALIINTSRGPVIDEQALADALNAGKIGGAGLDVLATEPPKADCPLLGAKNCVITPHIAWAAKETRARLLSILEENLRAFLEGNPQNVVNL